MKSGIYRIQIGDYFYWGQSQNLAKREYAHLYMLKNGSHRNSFMQNVYNKYQKFEFVVVDRLSVERLNDQEQEYLDTFIDDDQCMNIARYAEAPTRGRNHSDETKRKISEAASNRSDEYKQKLSEVHWKQVVINGCLYPSIKEASKALGVPRTTISSWLKGHRNPSPRRGIYQIAYYEGTQCLQ